MVYKNLDALARDLEHVVPRIRAKRHEALVKIAEVATGRIATRMDQGIEPDITSDTRRRRKVDQFSPALEDSRELYDAVTATTSGMPHSAFSIDDRNGVITIGVVGRPDADSHEFGIDRPGHFEPKREFLPLDDEFWDDVLRDSGAIETLLSEAGL